MLVAMHILALRRVGSTTLMASDIKKPGTNGWPLDAVVPPLPSPWDMIGVAGFLFFFCAIIYLDPDSRAISSRNRTWGGQWPEGTGAYLVCVVLALLRHPACGCLTSCWAVIMLGLHRCCSCCLAGSPARCAQCSTAPCTTEHLAQWWSASLSWGCLGVLPSTPTLTLIAQLCPLG